MSIEEYLQCSKTSIEDLITFAKQQKMENSIIRGLYIKKKEFEAYKKPFDKNFYIDSVEIMVNGEAVKPTEEDVDKCLAYMEACGKYVCDKTARAVIKSYIKGELDITIPENLDTENSRQEAEEPTKLQEVDDKQIELTNKLSEVEQTIEQAKKTLGDKNPKSPEDVGE